MRTRRPKSRIGSKKALACKAIAVGAVLTAELSSLAPLIAQPERAGVEFRVDDQSAVASDAAVAASADGAFVVVWRSAAKGTTEVRGQRFDPRGERVGDPIVIASVDSQGGQPALAVSEEGGFLVMWPARRRGGCPGRALFGVQRTEAQEAERGRRDEPRRRACRCLLQQLLPTARCDPPSS
jgi:hypothetical protein